jgi:hypothetical protein
VLAPSKWAGLKGVKYKFAKLAFLHDIDPS